MLAALLDTGYEPAQPLQPAGCVVVDAVDSVALIVEGDQGIACTAMSGIILGTQWGLCGGMQGAEQDGTQRGTVHWGRDEGECVGVQRFHGA